jgi:hypothetical protein
MADAAPPGGDFTFSFAPPQTAWEDAFAEAAPAGAPSASDAGAAGGADAAAEPPSPTQDVEDQLMARFKDQLEAVMEESLGPLLASGGALDPATARKIARETSACCVRR